MKLWFKAVGTICLVLLLSACTLPVTESSSESEQPKPSENQPDVSVEPKKAEESEEPSESEQDTVQLSIFFMPDGTIANYLGEGNEYASYRSRTQWHNDNTVSIFEENGGTTMLRTYRITDEAIVLIKEEGEFYDEFNPTNDELNALPPISTYLQLPLKEGTTFNGWKILSVNETVETPFQPFTNVILLEENNESGSINRKYIVKDYGEVKREFIMKDDDEEFSVTSTLESVE